MLVMISSLLKFIYDLLWRIFHVHMRGMCVLLLWECSIYRDLDLQIISIYLYLSVKSI